MDLKIFWTEFARKELKMIFKFYQKKASFEIAKNLIEEIYNATLILKSQPKIGSVEKLLQDRNQEFRYLIHKNYKILYWLNIQNQWIEIIDVFDTRQNPIKIKRNT